MLRNYIYYDTPYLKKFLNEVLSLNAQEYRVLKLSRAQDSFLNEVLSLNAQESPLFLASMKKLFSSMKS